MSLLVAVGIAVAGCGGGSNPDDMSTPTVATVSSGGSIDVCQYLTQSDAQSMLGTATGPGKLEHIHDTDGTCAYTPNPPKVVGERVALTVTTGDFAAQTVKDFKESFGEATPVEGLGFEAVRSKDGSSFAAQTATRACTLLMSVKKPADPDAFAKQVGGVCKKALAG
jgi:hypothetical protein